MEISGEISDLISKIDKCEMDIEFAETSMNIYAYDGYSSRYTRGEYARAKKKRRKPNQIWINIPRNFQRNLHP